MIIRLIALMLLQSLCCVAAADSGVLEESSSDSLIVQLGVAPLQAPTIALHSFMLAHVVNRAHHCVTLTSPSGEQFMIPKGTKKPIDRVIPIQMAVDLTKMPLEAVVKQFWTIRKGKHPYVIVNDKDGTGIVRITDEGKLDERKPIGSSSDRFLRQSLVLHHVTGMDRKKAFELVLDGELEKRTSRVIGSVESIS